MPSPFFDMVPRVPRTSLHLPNDFPRRKTLVLIGIGLVVVLGIFLLAYARYFGPRDPSAAATEFIVQPDEEFDTIAHDLKEQGFIRSATALRAAYAVFGQGRKVVEGGYEISASMDVLTIASRLASPPYLAWVTFPPGLRKEQVAAILAKKLGWSDAVKKKWIDVDTATPSEYVEGVYYGDTYLIPYDQDPAQIAARLRGRFQEVIAPYASAAAASGRSWSSIITMASLVEREAGKDDQALIAGILWNRLRVGMRLQVDATLQYIRGTDGDWWPTPTSADKSIDSPYNTYKYSGLPPHPIASPSLESIEAALNPAKTSCLYYLHDTDGKIHCSATYDGQLANVRKYLK